MWRSIRELVAERGDDLPDHPVPRRGRSARRPRSRCWTAAGSSPRAVPDELKRRIPGGHVRLQFADPDAWKSAAGLLGAASRDEENLTLQVPSDGTVASLRRLLGRLDDARIEVEQLSIHTPDLDDVFFAVTGRPGRNRATPRRKHPAMSTLAYTVTDSATMLRRNLRRLLRYPSMTLLLVGMPIVFLLLFVYVFGGQLGARAHRLAGGHAGRAATSTMSMPGILLITVAAAAQGTAITVAMDMTDGHHRPVPHDGHRSRLGAHRPRDRQRDPGPVRPGRRARRRARTRLPARPRPGRTGWRPSAC